MNQDQILKLFDSMIRYSSINDSFYKRWAVFVPMSCNFHTISPRRKQLLCFKNIQWYIIIFNVVISRDKWTCMIHISFCIWMLDDLAQCEVQNPALRCTVEPATAFFPKIHQKFSPSIWTELPEDNNVAPCHVDCRCCISFKIETRICMTDPFHFTRGECYWSLRTQNAFNSFKHELIVLKMMWLLTECLNEIKIKGITANAVTLKWSLQKYTNIAKNKNQVKHREMYSIAGNQISLSWLGK